MIAFSTGEASLFDGLSQLSESLVLDLPDPFLGDTDEFSHLGKGQRATTPARLETKSMLENNQFDGGEIGLVLLHELLDLACRIPLILAAFDSRRDRPLTSMVGSNVVGNRWRCRVSFMPWR